MKQQHLTVVPRLASNPWTSAVFMPHILSRRDHGLHLLGPLVYLLGTANTEVNIKPACYLTLLCHCTLSVSHCVTGNVMMSQDDTITCYRPVRTSRLVGRLACQQPEVSCFQLNPNYHISTLLLILQHMEVRMTDQWNCLKSCQNLCRGVHV